MLAMVSQMEGRELVRGCGLRTISGNRVVI